MLTTSNPTMNKTKTSNILPLILLLLIVILALFSWIGSACGLPIHSLFSADGLRWSFSSFIPNAASAPWGEILVGLMTCSVVWRSGIMSSMKHGASLKQRRALSVALLVLLIESAIVLVLLLPPSMVLLNPFGGLAHSPLLRGLYGILCVALIVVGNVYGLSSGTFVTMADAVGAHLTLLRQSLTLVPSVILMSQLVSCIRYMQLLTPNTTAAQWLTPCLYAVVVALSLPSPQMHKR